MEFRVLGPLEVVRDGERLSLGAAQQRALLALLVLHRGQAVAVDRLVDELWDERAPATATKTVQVYISRLRKALGPGVIVSEGRGYRLTAPTGAVDADQFELLCVEGRQALAGGNPAQASERLSSALCLWRGEPFADFAYERFAQDAIRALREARLSTLEDRIEADLMTGVDGHLVPELESLIASNPLRERLRGQLMLALYRAGRQADALAVYRQTSDLLRDELGLEPGPSLRRLERAILDHDSTLSPAAGDAASTRVCPFKGLASFERADAQYFCGRDRLVSDLLGRLVEAPLAGILGPSGIGKSSLLRAGLLPALGEGALPGSTEWDQVLLRPGEHPVDVLRDALGGRSLDDVLADRRPAERLIVAVDQLEELFTVCRVEAERSAFLQQLVTAASVRDQRVLVLLSLRADFYGRLARYPGFAALLSSSHVLVGPMGRDELRQAIERPASRVGLEVEPALLDALICDVDGEPGGLPLLSTTLLELWRSCDGRMLRHDSYRAIGGVRGAVARLADGAYARLNERDRGIARTVMLRLAGGESDSLSRRRVPLSEMEQIDGAPLVVGELVDARLLTISDDEVELSHEALLREWPRYRTWLEEDQAGRRLHAHLIASARDWESSGRDANELYRGARLTETVAWATENDDQLNALQRDFVRSSRLTAERHTRRLRIALLGVCGLLVLAVVAGAIAVVGQRDARQEARTALARQIGADAVNEPRLDVAMLLAREAVRLDHSPQTESTLLETLERNPTIFGAFTLPLNVAPELAMSPDARTLTVSTSRINLYGEDAGCGCLGSVRFYNPRTHLRDQPSLTDFFGTEPPVYSSDGSLIVYPTDTTRPSVAVRSTRTSALIARLTFDPFQVGSETVDIAHARVLVSPDAHTVYCAYQVFAVDRVSSQPHLAGSYLARWSLPDARLESTTRIDSRAALSVRLVNGGSRIVVADARRITTFDAHSLRRLDAVAITPAPDTPSAAAISPDGRIVAIGSSDGRMSFVDSTTGRLRPGRGPAGDAVTDVDYGPDGRKVVSTADDNDVIVWNPRTARAAQVLTTPAEQVEGVAFSPDSSTLYTSSVGGILLEWDLTGHRSFGRRLDLGSGTPCCRAVTPLSPPLALSPQGTRFAVRLGTSTVGVFSVRSLRREATFTIRPRTTLITALAWSPTAAELAVGGSAGHVQIWRVARAPQLERSLIGLSPIAGLPEAVQALAYSPNGRLLLASDSSETQQAPGAGDISRLGNRLSLLATWNAATGRPVGTPRDLGTGLAHHVGALAFSPNGHLLAVSVPSVNNALIASVLVFDTATHRVLRTLHPLGGADDGTTALAFAPDGTLATGTSAGILQLWNPTRGTQVAAPLAVDAGPVTAIAFDATGQRIATTGGRDGTAKLWFTSSLQPEGTGFETDQRTAASVTFAHDERLLVVDTRGNAFIWPASPTDWEQRACAVAGRTLTRAEWAHFLGGTHYAQVCP